MKFKSNEWNIHFIIKFISFYLNENKFSFSSVMSNILQVLVSTYYSHKVDADTYLYLFEQILLFPQNSLIVAPECLY